MNQFFYDESSGLLICRQGFRKVFYQLTSNDLQSSSSIWNSGIYVLGSNFEEEKEEEVTSAVDYYQQNLYFSQLLSNITSAVIPSYSLDQFIPENYKIPVEFNNTYFDENFHLLSQQNDNLETLIQNLEANVINNFDQQIWDVVTDFDHKLEHLANQTKDDFEEIQKSHSVRKN